MELYVITGIFTLLNTFGVQFAAGLDHNVNDKAQTRVYEEKVDVAHDNSPKSLSEAFRKRRDAVPPCFDSAVC